MANANTQPLPTLTWPIVIDGAKYPVSATSFENALVRTLDAGNDTAYCEEFPFNAICPSYFEQ